MKEVLKAFVLIAAQMAVVVRVPSDHDLTKADAMQALTNRVAKITHYRFMDGEEGERFWRTMDGEKAKSVAWIDFPKTPKVAIEGKDKLSFGTAVLAYFDNGLKASIAEHMGIKAPKGTALTGFVDKGGERFFLETDNRGTFIYDSRICVNSTDHIIKGTSRVSIKGDHSGYTVQTFVPTDKEAHPVKKSSKLYICGDCERRAAIAVKVANTPPVVPEKAIKVRSPKAIPIRDLQAKTNNEKFTMYEEQLTALRARVNRADGHATDLEVKLEDLQFTFDQAVDAINQKDTIIAQTSEVIAAKDLLITTLREEMNANTATIEGLTSQPEYACAATVKLSESADKSAQNLITEFEKLLEAKSANNRTHITSIGQMYRDLQWMKEHSK